jgi:hypothetical protein
VVCVVALATTVVAAFQRMPIVSAGGDWPRLAGRQELGSVSVAENLGYMVVNETRVPLLLTLSAFQSLVRR